MSIDHGRRRFVKSAALLTGTTLFSPRVIAAPDDTLDINIVNTAGPPQFAFQTLLENRGYLKEFGINNKTINVADGVRIVAALVGGDGDVCMASGFGQVLPAVEKGAAIRVIAGSNLLTNQGVLTSRSDVKSIADLKGKTVGSGPVGALEQQLMVGLLLRHNVDPDTVRFVNIGNVVDIYRAIVAGQIDAGPVNIDVYDKLNGDLKIIGDIWTELPDYPYQGSYASLAAIANKREALVRTLAAYSKMYRYLRTPESKQPYIDAFVQAAGGANAAVDAAKFWQFFYDTKGYATDLVIPDKSLNFMQDLNIKTGAQKAVLPLAAFSDMSLAREALKRLE